MVWLRISLIINILWTSGCSHHRQKETLGPLTMMDVYVQSTGQAKKDVAEFIEKNLKEEKTFGYVRPYIPVVNEPVVKKVWIPDHKSEDNSDVMIAGHWTYLMIQPATWFIEGKTVDTRFPVMIPSQPSQKAILKPKEVKNYYGNQNRATTEDI